MRVEHITDSIWLIHAFMSDQECDDLIIYSEMRGYDEAQVSLRSGSTMMKNLRNNDRILFEDISLANRLWNRLKEYCPSILDDRIAIGLNERFRFYRYTAGQRFKRHIDGRFVRNESEESRITFMVYLNDECEGGETVFDAVSIEPKKGTALCFIHELKHESKPLTDGVKYALRSDVMYRK